jgi:bile acid-coenzyme A ligase
MQPGVVSFGSRLNQLTERDPTFPVVTEVGVDGTSMTITRSEMDRLSNRIAHGLLAAGVGSTTWVVVRLRNGIDHYATSIGAWKIGARVLPLSHSLPTHEQDQILSVVTPALVVSTDHDGALSPLELVAGQPETPLPDVVSHPGKGICSGGSTGVPKVIVEPEPWAMPGGILTGPFDAFAKKIGMNGSQTQLVAGPLYHNAPFCWSYWGMYMGQRLVVMTKFDAELALDLIESQGVNFFFAVPTMMLRMARSAPETRDLSSLDAMFHGATPCPEWVKRRWFELIGPERVFEIYGGTEATGFTTLNGVDWQEHLGSVGPPLAGKIRILDENREPLPAGEIGEVFMRLDDPPHLRYYYLNSPPLEVVDGFANLGDFGRVDKDGYLYIVERRVDMIVTGGANVFPAEVEGALSEHPAIADIVVVGVPDDEWGRRVHAVVQLEDPSNPPQTDELIEFARQRLAHFKVPKTFEVVTVMPRDESGKVRRRAIAEAAAD